MSAKLRARPGLLPWVVRALRLGRRLGIRPTAAQEKRLIGWLKRRADPEIVEG